MMVAGLVAVLSAGFAHAPKAAAQLQGLVVSAGGPYSGTVGQPITFTGTATNYPLSSTLSWFWVFPDGSNASGQVVSRPFSSPISGQVSLRVDTSTGSSGSDRTSLSVGGPSTTISAGGPYRGAAGQPVVMSASVNGSTFYRFSWSYGDGATDGPAATVSHVYAGPGTYTVTVSATSPTTGQSVGPTTTTATIAGAAPVIVNPGGPYSGQVGQSISFFAFTSPANAGLSYLWSFGDGTSAAGQSSAHVYQVAGNYSVSVSVSGGGQTGTGSTQASISGNFTVSAGGPYTGAAGQSINLGASANGNLATVQWRWDFGDGTNSGAPQFSPSTSHTYATGGQYTLTVTGLDGPTGQTVQTARTTVVVAAGLQVSAGGSYSGTVGQALTFSASATNPPFDTQYSWTFGDGTSGAGQTVTHAFSSAGAYVITLSASSASTGQRSTSSATANVALPQSIVVTINGPSQGTTGSTLSFSASATGNFPGSPVFLWNFGDGTPQVQAPQVQHAFANAGTYTVTVTGASNVSGGLNSQSSTTVNIQPAGPSVTYPAGWNLVSAPGGTTFSQASGALFTFQAGDANYRSLAPAQGVSAGLGYWAFFTAATTVTFNGNGSTSASISAPAGQYVMIGNPSAANTLRVTGADSVIVYNATSGGYANATTLAPGQGAWALSSAGGTIIVGP
jgi:PKD repeat protein